MKYHDTILTMPGSTGYCNAIDKSRSMLSTQEYLNTTTNNNNTRSIQNNLQYKVHVVDRKYLNTTVVWRRRRSRVRRAV